MIDRVELLESGHFRFEKCIQNNNQDFWVSLRQTFLRWLVCFSSLSPFLRVRERTVTDHGTNRYRYKVSVRGRGSNLRPSVLDTFVFHKHNTRERTSYHVSGSHPRCRRSLLCQSDNTPVVMDPQSPHYSRVTPGRALRMFPRPYLECRDYKSPPQIADS